jgi:uncharacterized membrane protein YGL010W
MTDFFRREIAAYADYHRDERNAATHIFGIPIIFVSVVLPLDLWTVAAFGVQTVAANLIVAAVLIVWIALDAGVGLSLVVAVIPLMLLAAAIAANAGTLTVWLIAVALFVVGWALQILGHARFEHRRPALLDNPVHLLIGPMFIMAKLLVALGLRRDLAAIIEQTPRREPRGVAL